MTINTDKKTVDASVYPQLTTDVVSISAGHNFNVSNPSKMDYQVLGGAFSQFFMGPTMGPMGMNNGWDLGGIVYDITHR